MMPPEPDSPDEHRFLRDALEGALRAESSSSPRQHETPEWLAEAAVDWEAGEFVGRGGAGFVWQAVGRKQGRAAALKVIPFLGDVEEARLRWLREARLAADLDHPHLVKIYDYGLAPDALSGWLAMEWMEGGSLDARLPDAPTFTWRQVRSWAFQACRGLEALHEGGLVHRDIKPGNLLLDPKGERLVISDFGLIIPTGESWLTQTRLVRVTPGYAAPERWQNPVSSLPATDQYSLAATLWHLLSGHLPMGAFGALPPEIPRGVETVLRRALSPRPEDRYSDLNSFRLALARNEGSFLHGLKRMYPCLLSAAFLSLAWFAFFKPDPKPTPPAPPAYPLLFESETLQVVPSRRGFAEMTATVQEDGGTSIVITMDNQELLLGQTTIGEVRFLNQQGRILHRFFSNPFGINGRLIPGAPSQRTENFGGRIPPDILPQISDTSFHVHPGNWNMESRHDVFMRSLRDQLDKFAE